MVTGLIGSRVVAPTTAQLRRGVGPGGTLMALVVRPRRLVAFAPLAILFWLEGRPAEAADLVADPPAVVLGTEPELPAAASRSPVVQVYRAACLKCHDTDGKGEIVRD